jgi:hypothetical protein
VTVNRKGALANLKKPADALKSSDAGGYVYMDNISGLAVKLRFPTLLKLKNNKNVAINKAELVLEPDQPLSGFTRISNLVAIKKMVLTAHYVIPQPMVLFMQIVRLKSHLCNQSQYLYL